MVHIYAIRIMDHNNKAIGESMKKFNIIRNSTVCFELLRNLRITIISSLYAYTNENAVKVTNNVLWPTTHYLLL